MPLCHHATMPECQNATAVSSAALAPASSLLARFARHAQTAVADPDMVLHTPIRGMRSGGCAAPGASRLRLQRRAPHHGPFPRSTQPPLVCAQTASPASASAALPELGVSRPRIASWHPTAFGNSIRYRSCVPAPTKRRPRPLPILTPSVPPPWCPVLDRSL